MECEKALRKLLSKVALNGDYYDYSKGENSMVSVNCNVEITFTNEEKEILQKAQKILDNTEKELWRSDNEDAIDLSYIFCEAAYSIEKILKGNY